MYDDVCVYRLGLGFDSDVIWDANTKWSNPHVCFGADAKTAVCQQGVAHGNELGVCGRYKFSEVQQFLTSRPYIHRWSITIRAHIEDSMFVGLLLRGDEDQAPDWVRKSDFPLLRTTFFVLTPFQAFLSGSIGLSAMTEGPFSRRFQLPDGPSLFNACIDEKTQSRTVEFKFELNMLLGRLHLWIQGHKLCQIWQSELGVLQTQPPWQPSIWQNRLIQPKCQSPNLPIGRTTSKLNKPHLLPRHIFILEPG